MKTKQFTFQYSKAEGGVQRKTEEELTLGERNAILSDLINQWNNSTLEARGELIGAIAAMDAESASEDIDIPILEEKIIKGEPDNQLELDLSLTPDVTPEEPNKVPSPQDTSEEEELPSKPVESEGSFAGNAPLPMEEIDKKFEKVKEGLSQTPAQEIPEVETPKSKENESKS